MAVSSKTETVCRWLALLLVAGVAAAFALQTVNDYDLWWHLRTGQWIVENLAFPTVDTFSFATAGAAWSNFCYWLSDPLFYLLYQWTGLDGLLLFKALLIAAAAAGLFRFVVARGLPPFFAAALLIWTLYLARFRFTLRPLIFKFAGIVFLFWFFFGKGGGRWRYPLFFGVVLLWGLLYPAAFLAQLFALFLLLEKLVEKALRSPRYQAGELRDALILVALATLALLNSSGDINLFRIVAGGVQAPMARFVEEQQALNWGRSLGFTALTALAGTSFLLGRRNFRLLTLLIYLAFVVLAAGGVRYVGLSAFALAGVIGVNLGGCPFWSGPLSRKLAAWRWLPPVGVGALAVLGIFLWSVTFTRDRVYQFGLGVNQSRYPHAAVRLLKELNFAGNIYNSWKFGGYLEWSLPAAKTFIDGRCLPAQLELYERFQTIDLHAFSRYLTEQGVGAALLDRQEARDVGYFAAMPGFRQLHADDLSVLFVRNDLLAGAPAVAAGKYKYLRLGGYEFAYIKELAAGPRAGELEEEIRSAIAVAPDSFFENFLLACYFDARNDPRAAGQYLLAARKNPGFAFTHFGIGSRGGQAALKAGQWALAVEIAELALGYQKTGELYFLLGAARHQLKQWPAAERAYRESLSLAENGQLRNNLGFLLLEMERPDEARATFAKGLDARAGTDQELSLYGLALALDKLRRPADAAAARARLAASFPQSPYLKKLP